MIKAEASEWIDLIIDNLNGALPLYRDLDAQVFKNNTIPPYFSGVGKHLRHILDIFSCIVNGVDSGCIDFTDRHRGGGTESDQLVAYKYYQQVIKRLESLKVCELTDPVNVIDDFGGGCCLIPSTMASVLAQAHSHAIHHYASIGYLLYIQDVDIPLAAFGYNPTTPVQ